MAYHIISEKYNSFLWLPPKTASSHTSWVLAHFDFDLYYYDSELKEFLLIQTDGPHFGHSFNMHPNHENMNFICTMRNPYHRVLSHFKSSRAPFSPHLNPKEFEEFVKIQVMEKNRFMDYDIFRDKFPDYVIRSENYYEDLLNIPFIKESKLYKTGILSQMCEKRLNKTYEVENDKFLTQYVKDMIYEKYKKHFELFGYEK